MKNEKPILFQTWGIKAIQAGQKIQTRRVIKPQPNSRHYRIDFENNILKESNKLNGCWNVVKKQKSKYKKGMELWVRETFCKGKIIAGEVGEGLSDEWYISQCSDEDDYIYKQMCIDEDIGIEEVVWTPSIFMPRAASRITLIVKDVRIERLKDITVNDIQDEGIKYKDLFQDLKDGHLSTSEYGYFIVKRWIKLWDSINAVPKPAFKTLKEKIITHYNSFPWSEDTIDKREKINGKPHYCYPNPWLYRIEFEVKK